MKHQTVNLQSYTDQIPLDNVIVKVAIKPNEFERNLLGAIQTQTFEDAIYEDGFVKLPNSPTWHLASNFLFHKLKRKSFTN